MYVYGYSCRYEEDEERGKVKRNWKIYIKGTLNALSSTAKYLLNIFACFVKCLWFCFVCISNMEIQKASALQTKL